MTDTTRELSDAQLRDYLQTARDIGDDRDRLVAFTLANTAIRARELAHMTSEWLQRDASEIHIPDVEECTCVACKDRLSMVQEAQPARDVLYERQLELLADRHDLVEEATTVTDQEDIKALEEQATSLHRQAAFVRRCIDYNWYDKLHRRVGKDAERIVDEYDGVWWPRKPSFSRMNPVADPETRDYLLAFFDANERIDMDFEEINEQAWDLGEKSTLSRRVDPLALRDTYRRRLADLGFSPFEMTAVLGYESTTVVENHLRDYNDRIRTAFERNWERL